ncbi:diguanylate cyclase [Methylobacterium sp. XJLW]|uniref:PAS domain-containing protein n=1 Tax=Methylobacterium sp. XJLW TaxID=739141 RepID=UPI000DAAF87A|nr:PAS domain-containing protein [Methylobacterium sp. XJLW]AWV15700.1 diguanylate cyclase [Methylobacterium sp. XJLW]
MMLASTAASALQAAGLIGLWDTDVRVGRSVLDTGAASLLAGDPRLAGTPLPLDAALGRIHPADRDWVFGRIHHVRRTGGPVSLEFRILTGAGETRWILNRGCLTPDADGALRGRGAYIDVTDLHPPSVRDAEGSGAAQGADLNVAADHGIAVHAALERHGDPYLKTVSEMLLLGIGRALARREP